MGCGFSAKLPPTDLEWLSQHTRHKADEIEEMYVGFQNDFPGGLTLEQFTNLFPDLNNGMATANLVFRVLDEDNSEKLGFKEFLQAIDLVGARTPDDKLRWAFKMYDEDNSREIDIREMESVMVSIYTMLEAGGVVLRGDPVEKARENFKRMDKDGGGSLTEDEFIKGSMEDDEMMLMLDALFESMTGSGFLSQAEKTVKTKDG